MKKKLKLAFSQNEFDLKMCHRQWDRTNDKNDEPTMTHKNHTVELN